MPENQPPVIEWADDAKPLAICMICNAEFPETETHCPTCHQKLALMHRCPKCGRIVSAKHLRCPFCTRQFVKGEELDAPLSDALTLKVEIDKARIREHQGKRQKLVLLFSLGVFALVFVIAALVLHFQSKGPSRSSLLGSSYALRVLDVRRTPSAQVYSVGKLAAGAVVQITGIQRDDQGIDWFAIQQENTSGYVRVDELAPPKGANADGGYQLLNISIADLKYSAEAGNALLAADLYRRTYPADPRGQELLWRLAGKCRELGVGSQSRDMLATARRAYQELVAANGEYSARSLEFLKEIPELPPTRSSGSRPGKDATPAASGLEIIGASNIQPAANKQAAPHTLTLLNQTKVMVALPNAQVQQGEALQAHVASDVITNNEIAIPGGSVCQVKVTGLSDSAVAGQKLVSLQLQSVQVDNRSYTVDSMAVQLPVRDLSLKAGSPVLFRLRRSLVLSR